MVKKIGFVGTGTMGSRMIKNLTGKGYSIIAFDVSEKSRESAKANGAAVTENLEELLAEVDDICLSLPGPEIVDITVENILKVDGVKGKLLIDFSTINPETARSVAEKCEDKGVKYLEAPVSGSTIGASEGTLAIMTGGKDDVFSQAKSILDDVGSNVKHMGPTGAGSVTKLCNNILVGITSIGLSEAFLVASENGVSTEDLIEVIKVSSGGSRALELWEDKFISGEFDEPRFALDLMRKDMRLFSETSTKSDLPSPISTLALQLYNGAHSHQDFTGQKDLAYVSEYMELASNRKIKRS